jgi:hypothetical protein
VFDDEGDNNIRRINEMAIKYISKKTSLILVVLHCTGMCSLQIVEAMRTELQNLDDIMNQPAGYLARRYDPKAQRTISKLY